jgi:hypothetical protein
MAEPVTSQDIQDHPWLSAWNTIDQGGKIDILRAKVSELEDLLGTLSVIMLTLLTLLPILSATAFTQGSISASQVNQISGFIKQFSGK